MTTSELTLFMGQLIGEGANAVILDGDYSLPTKEWFLGDFASALWTDLNRLGLEHYAANANDCDKFALDAVWIAHVSHFKANLKPGTGIAVGMFCYQRDAGGAHAINFAIVEEDGQPNIIFLEPQTQQQVYLSDTEAKNCISYII